MRNISKLSDGVHWTSDGVRQSPTESVGYPTEFRRTQNKLNNFGISESDRSCQASDRSPSDLKMNLKNGKKTYQ